MKRRGICAVLLGTTLLGAAMLAAFAGGAAVRLLGGMAMEPDTVREYADRSQNGEAARRLGGIPGVASAAVLSRGKEVLAGVSVPEDARTEETEARARGILTETFGAACEITVAAGGTNAADIAELAYCLKEGVSARAADRRFTQLRDRVRAGVE